MSSVVCLGNIWLGPGIGAAMLRNTSRWIIFFIRHRATAAEIRCELERTVQIIDAERWLGRLKGFLQVSFHIARDLGDQSNETILLVGG